MFISRPCGGAAHRDGMQIILGRATPVQTLPPGAGRGQPGCPPPSLPPPGGGARFPPLAGAVFVGGRSPPRPSRGRGYGATRLPPSQPPPAGGKRPVPSPGGGGVRRRATPAQTLPPGEGNGATRLPPSQPPPPAGGRRPVPSPGGGGLGWYQSPAALARTMRGCRG